MTPDPDLRKSNIDRALARKTAENFRVVDRGSRFISAPKNVENVLAEINDKIGPTATLSILVQFSESIGIGDVVTYLSSGKVKKASNALVSDCGTILVALEAGGVGTTKRCQYGGIVYINLLLGEGVKVTPNMPIFISSTSGSGTITAPVSNIQKEIGYATGAVVGDTAEIIISPGMIVFV